MIMNLTTTVTYDVNFDTEKFEKEFGHYPTKEEIVDTINNEFESNVLSSNFSIGSSSFKLEKIVKSKYNTKYAEKKIKRGVGSY